MFWTTEKVKENLEHFSKYGCSFISRIDEEYSPHFGKTEILHINSSAFKNNDKINISGENISIMCTSETNIINFMASVYDIRLQEREMDILDYELQKIRSCSQKSFQHCYIDRKLYVCFALNSKILDIGFEQFVFPNAFSYIMSGIEEIGETAKNVRNKLNSMYRSLGY